MVYIARMIKYALLQRSNTFELFGADFMLDDNLKLWFIESNTSPMMEATTDDRTILLLRL